MDMFVQYLHHMYTIKNMHSFIKYVEVRMWAAEDLGDEKLRSLKANGFFPQGSLFPWIIFI